MYIQSLHQNPSQNKPLELATLIPPNHHLCATKTASHYQKVNKESSSYKKHIHYIYLHNWLYSPHDHLHTFGQFQNPSQNHGNYIHIWPIPIFGIKKIPSNKFHHHIHKFSIPKIEQPLQLLDQNWSRKGTLLPTRHKCKCHFHHHHYN